jgi:cobalt/nickel transport system permease protein
MHIPDGYLSPQTYVPLYGVSAFFWAISLKKLRRVLSEKEIPYLAMAGAFSFLIQMFNIPIPGGTTGHAVGGAITAILLGPWAAVIAISTVLIIQAIVFGDGGITAIGANCFNMAIVIPFVSYWIFRALIGRHQVAGKNRLEAKVQDGSKRVYIAAFVSGYVGLTAGAILTAIEFGIQPLIARAPDGRPLYAPYPLKIAIPAMAIEHMLLFSIVEGAITAAILRYFIKHEPSLVWWQK